MGSSGVDDSWRCMFEEYYADLIETPIFMVQSLYDSSEVGDTLDLSCNLDKLCGDTEEADADEPNPKAKQSLATSTALTSSTELSSYNKCCAYWQVA